jgi:hypothetical protein
MDDVLAEVFDGVMEIFGLIACLIHASPSSPLLLFSQQELAHLP